MAQSVKAKPPPCPSCGELPADCLCYPCRHCARLVDLIGFRDCADCQAAVRWCPCGAPMVAKGLPVVYVCRMGCSSCPACGETVPIGQGCPCGLPLPSGDFAQRAVASWSSKKSKNPRQ